MRVLYVNHTSEIGGAERALLDLVDGLPADIEPLALCPPGALKTAFDERKIDVAAFPAIDGSFGSSAVRSCADVVALARAALAVKNRTRRRLVDLVHANSTRAGLAGIVANRIGGPPAVVHLHDCLPPGRRANLVKRVVNGYATRILANSRYTAKQFAPVGGRVTIRVVHNSADLERFDPNRLSRREARVRLGLDESHAVIGVVAQLTPWKGQDDAIRILASLRRRFEHAQLLLVGAVKFGHRTRHDNAAYRERLQQLARGLHVSDAVRFLGERDDVPEILRALDILLVPSWQEPFGLAVIEAMAMEVPVIATSVGGPAEIMTDDEHGLLLPPRQPERWSRAIESLLAKPERLLVMGQAGRRRVAAAFGRERYVNAVLSAYHDALAAGRPVHTRAGPRRAWRRATPAVRTKN